MFQTANLRVILAFHDKTAKEVAEAIGVTPVTLSNWMSGRSTPRPRHIQSLCEYFKTEATFWYAKIDINIPQPK